MLEFARLYEKAITEIMNCHTSNRERFFLQNELMTRRTLTNRGHVVYLPKLNERHWLRSFAYHLMMSPVLSAARCSLVRGVSHRSYFSSCQQFRDSMISIFNDILLDSHCRVNFEWHFILLTLCLHDPFHLYVTDGILRLEAYLNRVEAIGIDFG